MKEESLTAKKIIFKGERDSIFSKPNQMTLCNLSCVTYRKKTSMAAQRNQYMTPTAWELNFQILKPLAVSSLSLLVDSDSFIFSIFSLDIKESFSNRSLLKTSSSSFSTKTFFIF